MLVTKQLTVAVDPKVFFYLLWKSMATVSCLFTSIFYNPCCANVAVDYAESAHIMDFFKYLSCSV